MWQREREGGKGTHARFAQPGPSPPPIPRSGHVPRAAVAAAWARERDLGLTDADIDGVKCFVVDCERDMILKGGGVRIDHPPPSPP